MIPPARRRIFAGHQLRRLRKRLGLNQTVVAQRLSISVSYLSQIENDDRPITGSVLMALARAFPHDLADFEAEDHTELLVAAMEAGTDHLVPQDQLSSESIERGIKQQPLLLKRMIALHQAYQRSQEELRILDDRMNSGALEGGPLPWEEVRDWFQSEGNYIDAIDRGAEQLGEEIAGGGPPAARLEDRLRSRHGVRIVHHGPADEQGTLRHYSDEDRLLSISRSLPPETYAFLLAHQLMRLEMTDLLTELVDDAQLSSATSRKLLSVGLANYSAGALLMPYAAFRRAARELRHDIDQLRERFGVSFEQACHRLSTMQRPGAQGVPFFFCRIDMAGNITKRHSATRLQFARFGGACPLWIVHEAVAIPDRILVQLAETPDGARYVSKAKGLVKPSGRYSRPARRYAVALGCEVEHARDFVYGDHLDLSGPGSATLIGTSCRICPRTECDQRAFPPAARALEIDPDRRSVVPYSFQ